MANCLQVAEVRTAQTEIAPNAVLLRFEVDVAAEAFSEWWRAQGYQQFVDYVKFDDQYRRLLVEGA